MTTEERLELAERVAYALNTATAQGRDRQMTVKGADPNEVKKTFAFLRAARSVSHTLQLVKALQQSAFAQRSRRVEGYYRIIEQVLKQHGFASMPIEDALAVLGWACRLQTYLSSER